MKHYKKRVSKIVDELLTYFFHIGSKHIRIDIEEFPALYKVEFKCNIKDVLKEDLDKLSKCLDCEKTGEMEEYYWELTGESDIDTELSIVGMMIDTYELIVDRHELSLYITRNKI